MKVADLIETLKLNPFTGEIGVTREITGGYTSDLLSDVMGNVKDGDVWMTLQTHKNVIAIASLRDVAAVVLINGSEPDADMLEQAIEEEIPVLGTSLSCFDITGEIYNLIAK